MTIPGGYVLKPRKIKHSDISDASPCVRETWDYLIREANHKSFKRGKFEIKRGQLFRSYDEILDDLCWYVGWRKETYTKNQMKQAMKFLRDTERITTQKKPGGVLISVCNYSTYQDPSNYEQTTEETSEQTNEKPLNNHRQTSHNYKNVNNVKNDKNITKSVSTNGTDFPDSCEFLDEAREIANYLLDAIVLYDPTHKYANNQPAIDSWVLDIERAIRLDGRTKKQLKFIIDYVYKENKKHSAFWAGNIESGKKLRKHFDKIKNQIRQEATNGKASKQQNIEKEIQKFG
jgi:hypothetical protein